MAEPATGVLTFLSMPFRAAGTVRWTRGWIWLALAVLSMAVFLGVAGLKNPGLLRARLGSRMPTRRFDKAFVVLYVPSAAALFITARLDARWGWSHLSFAWMYAGIGLHIAGLIALCAVAATNPYLEGTVRIQSERGHVAVTTGPYAVVRHPMYVALMLMYLAWPLVLGSLWAYVPALLVVGSFVFRTAHEDRMLQRELPGYQDYARRTRYRLIPGVW